MDFAEYRLRGKEMVDYIADYLENIRDRRVYPNVKPGYMSQLIPHSAPLDAEPWDQVFGDVEKYIMPGITHWQSPYMHAYFPALNSFPSLLGDMLADAINCLGFTWASSPACTELEILIMNWLGKMIGLTDEFLHSSTNSKGGGVIQTTASEATLICLLASRTEAIQKYRDENETIESELDDAEINSRLVAYCSDQAHSSVEKAGLIGLVKLRYIESDDVYSLRVDKLIEAIECDKKKNLTPFFVCATLGTTAACAFDNLELIGPVCKKENLWLHVDAAYAGSSFICPEFRKWLKGIHYAQSFAFNPSKWLMVNFDCTAMWVKNCEALHRTFNVEPLYLRHENSGHGIDYMHWQIPLSKRFRALKLWFVIRSYGIKGLQNHIREGVKRAQKFESLVRSDSRFLIPAIRHLGLVVFSLQHGNHLTERLLKRLNTQGDIHCVPAALKDKYVIRFTVSSQYTTDDDIVKDWCKIENAATIIISEHETTKFLNVQGEYLTAAKKLGTFGTSLLLSNTPMSPKVVNGSFAAIFEKEDSVLSPWTQWLNQLCNETKFSPNLQKRTRGDLFRSRKQFSLDSRLNVVHQMFFRINSSPLLEFVKNTMNEDEIKEE
ncbi:hypothetical protein PGB90_009257 [Kerria lacca]